MCKKNYLISEELQRHTMVALRIGDLLHGHRPTMSAMGGTSDLAQAEDEDINIGSRSLTILSTGAV